MERLDLELNEFSRRAGSVSVAHTATALARGLEPGERVLIHSGESHVVATVRDIDFDLTDTYYRLELGATVARDDVAMLLTETAGAGSVDLSDVLGLLQEAQQRFGGRSASGVIRSVSGR